MASEDEHGDNASCTCLTEQGTRYEMDSLSCVPIARHGGSYNPFKTPSMATVQPKPFDSPQPAAGKPVGMKGEPGTIGTGRLREVWGNPPDNRQ